MTNFLIEKKVYGIFHSESTIGVRILIEDQVIDFCKYKKDVNNKRTFPLFFIYSDLYYEKYDSKSSFDNYTSNDKNQEK